MMEPKWRLGLYGTVFIFLLSGLALGFMASARPVRAQEEEFTWEGDWNLYQDSGDGTVPIRIMQSADGSYTLDVRGADNQNDDWHPPLDVARTVMVTGYRMMVIQESSYEGTIFSYSEMNFERTDNPAQLRGTYYFRTEHQFSGNDLGWNIVDNFIESKVVALCAARDGFSPPVPCMALGENFVPPGETSTEDETGAGQDAGEQAADFNVSLGCTPGRGAADQLAYITCQVNMNAQSQDLMAGGFDVIWQINGAAVQTTAGTGTSDSITFTDVVPGVYDVGVTVSSSLSSHPVSSVVSVLIEESASEGSTIAGDGQDTGQNAGSSNTPVDSGSSSDSQPATSPGQVSPGAQAAAAGATTGLLAFWWIMEFLTLAPLAEAGQPPENVTSTETAAPPPNTTVPPDSAAPPDMTPPPDSAALPDNTPLTEIASPADVAPPTDTAQATPPVQIAASQTTPVDPSRYLEVLQDKFQEIVKDKVEEGYYVRNPNLIEKIKNNFPVLSSTWDYFAGLEGGQCGDFAEWGNQWIKDWAQETYGPGVVVDQIWVGESSSRYPDGLGGAVDALIQSNHAATRILLPDGESVVVDFWDAVTKYQGNEASLPDIKPVPEAEWVYEWGGKIGTSNDPADICNVNALQEDLRSHIASFDAEHPGFAASGSQESFLENQEVMERAIESWQQENPQISAEVKQTIIQNWREHGSGWGLHRPEPPADPLTALFEEGLDLWYN